MVVDFSMSRSKVSKQLTILIKITPNPAEHKQEDFHGGGQGKLPQRRDKTHLQGLLLSSLSG